MNTGIILVGLGPGDSTQWTVAAYELLNDSEELYLHTARHPSVNDISAATHSFDQLYEQKLDDVEIQAQIAAEIVRLGQRDEGVVYAVPGHPSVDDPTVPRIEALAQTKNVAVTTIPGVSLLDATLTALNIGMLSNLQIVRASNFAGRHHPLLEPDRPVLITHLHKQGLITQIIKTLRNLYADNIAVTIIQNTGAAAERIWSCPLSTLNMQKGLTQAPISIYLPADPSQCGFSTFQETIAHLRAPDGCPWDREQTHQTLRPYLLEEAYEVLETLDANDPEALAEELGDLLLQIVLHTQIAIDTGEFNMGAVIDHINRKLIRRHPHVFGAVEISGVSDVTTNWEAIKKMEKAAKGQAEKDSSALDGVPDALPALAQALTISKRAVRVGFEWPNIEGVLDKVIEEAREIVEATNPEHLESEIGDLLFSVVNLARWRDIDAETALRTTNARFSQRFRQMESLVAAQQKNLSNLSIEEMDILWEEAKRLERESVATKF